MTDLEKRFPCVADMQAVARKRIPKFGLDYLEGGIGRGTTLEQNRGVMDTIRFQPQYITPKAFVPDYSTTLLGTEYHAPFGVAPIGLGGLIWPKIAEHLSAAAVNGGIPFILSGFATVTLETIAEITEGKAWYQHYVCADENVNADMLRRADAAGYQTLVITVDIPTATRRDHDIRNGLSVPPKFNWQTVLAAARCPAWMWETLLAGIPRFKNLEPYLPKNINMLSLAGLLQEMIEGHVHQEKMKWLRDLWKGKMLVKGILHPSDAEFCRQIGVDGLVVSNHGGRQLDACESAVEALPAIRDVVGHDMPLIADGGIRNGLDIARTLACGADFVLLGRPFAYAVGAMGQPGAAHAIDVLKQELRIVMSQLGCDQVRRLPEFLLE